MSSPSLVCRASMSGPAPDFSAAPTLSFSSFSSFGGLGAPGAGLLAPRPARACSLAALGGRGCGRERLGARLVVCAGLGGLDIARRIVVRVGVEGDGIVGRAGADRLERVPERIDAERAGEALRIGVALVRRGARRGAAGAAGDSVERLVGSGEQLRFGRRRFRFRGRGLLLGRLLLVCLCFSSGGGEPLASLSLAGGPAALSDFSSLPSVGAELAPCTPFLALAGFSSFTGLK